jgi:hypothetical protein
MFKRGAAPAPGRSPVASRIPLSAAMGGNLEELKALPADGCPWEEWTCTNAAEGGHLEMLQ